MKKYIIISVLMLLSFISYSQDRIILTCDSAVLLDKGFKVKTQISIDKDLIYIIIGSKVETIYYKQRIDNDSGMITIMTNERKGFFYSSMLNYVKYDGVMYCNCLITK